MVEEVLPDLKKQAYRTPSKPALKSVSCLYIPASDPRKTHDWFARHFGLERDGWIKLANGLSLMFIKAENEVRMSFPTNEWAGPNHQMNMLSFAVDDITELHRSLREGGVKVEDLRNNWGCGMEFYFYDPDGNKYCTWELQTMVRTNPEGANSPNWKERFRLENCCFDVDLDTFLKKAIDNEDGVSRRIQIVGHECDSDPEGLKELLGALELFNQEYSDKAFHIGYLVE